jgi:hypothetical protein
MLSLFGSADSERFEQEAWLKIRQSGRWRFILLNGVAYGVMFIGTNAIALVLQHRPLYWFLPFSALIWFGAGYWYGASRWSKYEYKYGPTPRQI